MRDGRPRTRTAHTSTTPPGAPDDVTLSGCVASEEAVTIHVALEVDGETVYERSVDGAFDLLLDGGARVAIETCWQTRVASELEPMRTAETWKRLAKHPDARGVESHAPGPHVRVALLRRVLRPGAAVVVRGAVAEYAIEQETQARYRVAARRAPSPKRLVASAITPERAEAASTMGRRGVAARAGGVVARAGGAVLAVTALLLFVRWVVLWPPELAIAKVASLRASAGAACAMHLAFWLSVVLQRPGSTARLLPRFVGANRRPLGSQLVAGLVVFGVVASLALGAGGALMLEKLLDTGDPTASGRNGRPLLESAWLPAAFLWVCSTCGILGLCLRERGEARLAALFRAHGDGWTVREGVLEEGELTISVHVNGHGRSATRHWSSEIDGALTIASDGETLTVRTAGIAWGIDTVACAPEQRGERWTVGPGAAVAIAGRLGHGTNLLARGPESLVVVATPCTCSVGASLVRGLWLRRAVLAAAVGGAILAIVLAYAGG
ncbi:MAG: hypothetical protein KF850_16785 [Labilithrix sp.]|nr:hypothetical protein [Labilithrix sp.]